MKYWANVYTVMFLCFSYESCVSAGAGNNGQTHLQGTFLFYTRVA